MSQAPKRNVKKFLISHLWWISLLLALIMLIAHTLSIDAVEVDNTSIILLIVILLSPFTTAITRIRIGDFEAEVDPEEVRRISEEVSIQSRDIGRTAEAPRVENTIDSIRDLVVSDPVLALAKLRIELEKALTKLYRLTHRDKFQERPLSVGRLLHSLENEEILPDNIARLTREVVSISNRAIHGEDIRKQDARSVVESGATLLRELSAFIHEYVLEPKESVQIDQDTVDKLRNARYEVTTVVPLVEAPYKNIRVVDQEGLDELLEGYTQYAEFLVEVTRIDSVQ